MREGVLTLEVKWGKLAGMTIEGKAPDFRQKTRLFSAMPFAKDRVLNMADVDQALDNLLRVSGTDKLVVGAASEPGYSLLDLQNTKVDPVSVSMGVNNSGQQNDGWNQYYASANLNNLAGLNDVFSAYYAQQDFRDPGNTQQIGSLSYSLPLGYWLFDANWYGSRYERLIGGQFGGYDSTGNSQRLSLKATRVLKRDGGGKTSAYAKVEVRDNNNAIEDFQIDISSKRYSSVNFGLTHVGEFLGGSIYWDMNVTGGTPWFNAAYRHDPDLAGYDPDYVKFGGLLNWSKGFQAGPLQSRL